MAEESAHPIFQNARNTWVEKVGRSVECFVEVPEWGPSPEKAYQIHIKPPKGLSVDSIASASRHSQPLEWSIRIICACAVEPIDRTPLFELRKDRERFLDMDDPKVIIRVAGEIVTKLSEAYPETPKDVKEPSSQAEPAT